MKSSQLIVLELLAFLILFMNLSGAFEEGVSQNDEAYGRELRRSSNQRIYNNPENRYKPMKSAQCEQFNDPEEISECMNKVAMDDEKADMKMIIIVACSVCGAVCVAFGIGIFIKVRYCKKKPQDAPPNSPPLETAPSVIDGERVQDESELDSDIDKTATPLSVPPQKGFVQTNKMQNQKQKNKLNDSHNQVQLTDMPMNKSEAGGQQAAVAKRNQPKNDGQAGKARGSGKNSRHQSKRTSKQNSKNDDSVSLDL